MVRMLIALAVFAVYGASSAVGAAEATALLYPEAVVTETNLLDGIEWRAMKVVGEGRPREAERTFGGPFSADEPAWTIETFAPVPAYWCARPAVEKGHEYLVGAWLRFANAKVLLLGSGKTAGTGKRIDERIYCFGGHNPHLDKFLSPRTLRKLAEGSEAWRLCFRRISFPEGVEDGRFNLWIGLYFAAGKMTFSHPFLIDVTGREDRALTVRLVGSKPVKEVSVEHAGLHDVIWKRTFAVPVMDFREKLSGITDFMRGLDADRVLGHALRVTYADGSAEAVCAPTDNECLRR